MDLYSVFTLGQIPIVVSCVIRETAKAISSDTVKKSDPCANYADTFAENNDCQIAIESARRRDLGAVRSVTVPFTVSPAPGKAVTIGIQS